MLRTFSQFYAQSPDTAVGNKLKFNVERKWTFLQPFVRLKMLFAQRPNSVAAYSKILIELSSNFQTNTDHYSTPEL
jgi:hypothetical protein